MILASEILQGRHREFPLSDELLDNLGRLLVAVNRIRKLYGKPMIVSSGYRPGHFNVSAGGSINSAHLTCQAVDFVDKGGYLANWCRANSHVLKDAGLYLEHPDATVGWCHLMIARPASGLTVFRP